jgi:stalled ribosome rescue protein Dom34
MTAKSYRRGYPVAVLVGLEQSQAAIWKIYSKVAKPEANICLGGTRNDAKILYGFYESIIDKLRPILKEGVKSIILAAPQKTSYRQNFLEHVKGHHQWLFQGANKATFKQISGSAVTHAQVSSITSSEEFKQAICDSTFEEAENFVELFEKRLNSTTAASAADGLVLFSLEEAENAIYRPEVQGAAKIEYLLITDSYLAGSKQKARLNRLMQIAQNKKIKTRVVSKESPAGVRLNQFGGLVVCYLLK